MQVKFPSPVKSDLENILRTIFYKCKFEQINNNHLLIYQTHYYSPSIGKGWESSLAVSA